MSIIKARRSQAYKDFTHYLSIPLATRSSRPHLNASFARFERETSAKIPKGSVQNPDFVTLGLGRLKLNSKDRVDACLKHLHGLDMHEMLRVAAVNAIGRQPDFQSLPYEGATPHAFGVATTIDFSPLKVDVSGISCSHPSHAVFLGSSVIDRTHWLQHFQHILLNSLFKAGFLVNAFHNQVGVVNTGLPSTWGHKRVYDRKTGRWYSPGRPRTPQFDARDLIQEWRDHDWVTNIQLEKLCVHGLGSRERLPDGGAREKRKTEIDSIALP
ncbi:MAG: hypothetical protein ALECFALPRED_002427 [Alectoria fallacina]|uniref:Uncharacterized protein n=1 Tax=Alectoria fallacina TaxID=1903189 RepID=A0A8H3I7U8_9LECA|nr:MAG: hypothetical protein ALECFALPRED_002427 [Alectoria fallacina]